MRVRMDFMGMSQVCHYWQASNASTAKEVAVSLRKCCFTPFMRAGEPAAGRALVAREPELPRAGRLVLRGRLRPVAARDDQSGAVAVARRVGISFLALATHPVFAERFHGPAAVAACIASNSSMAACFSSAVRSPSSFVEAQSSHVL